MSNRVSKFMAPAALLALSSQLLAGGFYLQLGNPEAHAEARQGNAVLVMKVAGCTDPGSAKVTAKATGLVDGRRQSIPLKLTKLSEPGAYALTQQWPKEGNWVIELTGHTGDLYTHTLVPAGPNGVDRLNAKSNTKTISPKAIEAMLK